MSGRAMGIEAFHLPLRHLPSKKKLFHLALCIAGATLILISFFGGSDAWILRKNCIQYAVFSYVKANLVLEGSVLRTLKGLSAAQCEAACIDEFFCKSINTQDGGERLCELNEGHVLDKWAKATLTSKTGWTHRATDYADLWVGEKCKAEMPCPINHVCVDTCECPGYQCIRCRGMKIGFDCMRNLAGLTGIALGMENGDVLAKQISSSSYYNEGTKPRYGRLNNKRDWAPLHNDANQYIQVGMTTTFGIGPKHPQTSSNNNGDILIQQLASFVKFYTRKIITAVAVQGSATHEGYMVTSYQLTYSEDGNNWQFYDEDGITKTFQGPKTSSEVAKRNLVYFIRAYGIRIRPKTMQHHIRLRMEIYGFEDPKQPPLPAEIDGYSFTMKTDAVGDEQLSASSAYNNDLTAKYARVGISPGWCAKKGTQSDYIRVDFPSRKILTAVAMQGVYYGGKGFFIKKYHIHYSEDSYAWKVYQSNGINVIFEGPTSATNIRKHALPHWVRFFSVKFHALPDQWVRGVCARLQLFGITDPEQPSYPDGCLNVERPLGISSGKIHDDNLAVSSEQNGYEKRNSRLNSYRGWCTIWDKNPYFAYIQVDLGKRMVITAVATQGSYPINDWVKSYHLGYKNSPSEKIRWITSEGANVTFQGNRNRYEIVKNKLNPTIKARFLRIGPEACERTCCLRFELYGCDIFQA
eukprot:gene5977-6673_t